MPSFVLPRFLSLPYLYNSVSVDVIISILQPGKLAVRAKKGELPGGTVTYTAVHGRAPVHATSASIWLLKLLYTVIIYMYPNTQVLYPKLCRSPWPNSQDP